MDSKAMFRMLSRSTDSMWDWPVGRGAIVGVLFPVGIVLLFFGWLALFIGVILVASGTVLAWPDPRNRGFVYHRFRRSFWDIWLLLRGGHVRGPQFGYANVTGFSGRRKRLRLPWTGAGHYQVTTPQGNMFWVSEVRTGKGRHSVYVIADGLGESIAQDPEASVLFSQQVASAVEKASASYGPDLRVTWLWSRRPPDRNPGRAHLRDHGRTVKDGDESPRGVVGSRTRGNNVEVLLELRKYGATIMSAVVINGVRPTSWSKYPSGSMLPWAVAEESPGLRIARDIVGRLKSIGVMRPRLATPEELVDLVHNGLDPLGAEGVYDELWIDADDKERYRKAYAESNPGDPVPPRPLHRSIAVKRGIFPAHWYSQKGLLSVNGTKTKIFFAGGFEAGEAHPRLIHTLYELSGVWVTSAVVYFTTPKEAEEKTVDRRIRDSDTEAVERRQHGKREKLSDKERARVTEGQEADVYWSRGPVPNCTVLMAVSSGTNNGLAHSVRVALTAYKEAGVVMKEIRSSSTLVTTMLDMYGIITGRFRLW